ncbi:MAG: nucleotidyltransferase domain-containing protein [Fusobacteriaceae bacterium]|jgi:predicted nucleotidyltransferase|nr:nucleotidyltransferase domain-containing protein [Fusobacteriaceae bacterium]
MLTLEQIKKAAEQVAKNYPLTKVSVFGSYASGTATEESDLDLLVEFTTDTVSLLDIIGVKYDFEDLLNKSVDVLHAPLPENSHLIINKEVRVYG